MADPAYIDAAGVLTVTEAWVGIGTTTLGSDTAVVTFTSPADGSSLDWSQFMDLVVVTYVQTSGTGYSSNEMYVTFNNVTSTSYGHENFIGSGTSVSAATGTTAQMEWGEFPGAHAGTNDFGCIVARMFDINSGKFKSLYSMSGGDRTGAGQVMLKAFTFSSQAPITEIDFAQAGGENYTAGSMFSLFGVLPSMLTTGTVA